MHTLNFDFPTDAPPATVRAALADSAGIQSWWSRDAEVGDTRAELRFVKGDRTVTMHFDVDRVTDEEVRWTCTANGNPVWVGTTLTWRFGDGRLALEHAGFGEDQSPPFVMTRDGWPHFMSSLESVLAGGEGQPI